MKRQSNQKEKPLVGPTTNGENLTNTIGLEGTFYNDTANLKDIQLKDTEILADVISGIDDESVYLLCDYVQRVRGGYLVYVKDVSDVRRAK